MASRKQDSDLVDAPLPFHTCVPGCEESFQTGLGSAAAEADGFLLDPAALRPPRLGLKQVRDALRLVSRRIEQLGDPRSLPFRSHLTMDFAKQFHDHLYHRASEAERHHLLLYLIHPVAFLVRGPRESELDAADCVALVSGADGARAVLRRRPSLRDVLREAGALSDGTRLCGLRVTALNCRPAPPLAVGLLAVDPAAPADLAERAAEVWRAMRGHRTDLPETPLSLPRLAEIAAEEPEHLAAPSPEPSPAEEAVTVPEPPAPPSAAPDFDALAAELSRLSASFGTAAESARRVHDAVIARRRPDSADLDRLVALASDVDRIGAAVCAVTGRESPPGALADLETELGAARTRAQRAGLLSRFAALTGPDEIEPVLAEIRAAASRDDGSETERLRSLAELLDCRERDPYDPELFGLAQDLMRSLPEPWGRAVMAGMAGRLSLGPAPAGPAEPPPAAPPPAAETTVEETPAPPPAPPAPPGSAGAAAAPAEPGTVPDEALADLDAALSRESAAAPAREEPTAAASVPAPHAEAPDRSAGDRRPPSPRPAGPAAHASGQGGAGEPPRSPAAPAPDPAPETADGAAGSEAAEKGSAASDRSPETPPASEPPPRPDTPEPVAPRPRSVVRLEQQALQQGRFALAGWLNRAAGAPENVVEIRHAAACAQQIRRPAGPMVEAFRGRAEALSADLPDKPADRLLAWAAAIRALLVAPIPEAFQLFERTTAATRDLPALHSIGEAFRTAAQSGGYLDLSHTGELLRDADQARRARGEAVRRASELRETAHTRTINYQAASALWRHMVSRNGPLWDLLDVPAENDTERLADCRRRVSELLGAGAIDDLIDRLYRESRRSSPNKKRNQTIIAGARTALRKNIEEVRDTADQWVAAVERLRSLDTPRSRDRSGHGLDGLRQVAAERYERAAAELAALADGDSPPLGAAARGARYLLDEVHDLLRGLAPRTNGLTVALTLNRDVLLVPRIRVPESGRVTGLPTVEELAEVLHGEPDRSRVCDQRIARGDLVGAGLVADLVRADDPALADRLVRRVAARVDAERAKLREMCEAFQTESALRRHNGTLSEDEHTRLRNAAQALVSAPERRDFDVMAAELAKLRAESDRLRDERVAGRKEEVRRAAAESDQVARYADRLRTYLDDGQVTSSDELLAQLKANRSGAAVPRVDEVDHFAAFYPALPKALERTQLRSRWGDSPVHPVIPELQSYLNQKWDGTGPAPVFAKHQALFTGLLATQSSPQERATAEEALRQWQTAARSPKSSGGLREAVEKILLLLGVEGSVPDDPLSITRGRMLPVSLSGVKLSGEALLPAFGSKMSPSGTELSVCLVWNRPEPRQLFDWLRDEPRDRTVLVLYFGLLTFEQRQSLAALARSRPSPVIAVVDDAVVGYLAALAQPEWSTTVRLIAPFTATHPFQAERMIPEEMFYGREDDLNAVMAPSGAHFVYGGRQLGKSVLLAEAARRLRAQRDRPVVIQRDVYRIGQSELQTEVFWTGLGSVLPEHGIVSADAPVPTTQQEVCDAIRRWSHAHPDRRLLLFFDEADEFLNLDAREYQFANVVALRELMNATDNRVKAVFAGLHKTARFRSFPNQPFANLGEPLGIGPLASQDAFDLLTRPLRVLGFHLPEALAVNIIAQANNAPAIVQYFGDLLLKRLRRSAAVTLPYEVTVEDVQAVRSGTDLDKAFRDRFEWTLELDQRYKVIAYAVALQTLDAHNAAVDEKDLLAECRLWWPTAFEGCSPDEFGALLEECVDLGVLTEEDGAFRLRTPHILTLLGGRSRVERELEEAESGYRLPDDNFDPAHYRSYYGDGPELSPLTVAQVARLGKPDGRIRMVVGSEALRLSWVPRTLRDVIAEVRGRCHLVRPGGLPLEEAVRRARGRDMVLVWLDDAVEAALAQIATAEAAVRGEAGRGLNVVLLARPRHAPLTAGALGYPVAESAADVLARVDVVELRRFGRSGVGQWRLLDDFARIARESFHEPLFEVTGGWPNLVNEVIRDVVGGGRRTPEEALRRCAERLRDDPDGLVLSSGVVDHPAVFAAWTQLADLGGESEKDLALLLGLAADEGGMARPVGGVDEEFPGLFATGDGSVDHAGLVGVLRGLGALVPVGQQRLAPEPVLLRAYRASRFARGTGDGR